MFNINNLSISLFLFKNKILEKDNKKNNAYINEHALVNQKISFGTSLNSKAQISESQKLADL